jgi:CheY-like chemotaxis protein
VKLRSVLLIDDDHTTNVFHTVILKRTQIADQILTMETPEIALEHLEKASRKENGAGFGQMSMPELIFLDVNMPRMTGYEFIKKFQNIYDGLKTKSAVYMLTAALYPQDHDKYLSFKCVKGVLQKPLTRECLENIMRTQFNQGLIS